MIILFLDERPSYFENSYLLWHKIKQNNRSQGNIFFSPLRRFLFPFVPAGIKEVLRERLATFALELL